MPSLSKDGQTPTSPGRDRRPIQRRATYFWVHGPRILIEYDVQEPLASQGGHVHGITRDPTNDYGMDWLGLHYQESAGPCGSGGPATRSS